MDALGLESLGVSDDSYFGYYKPQCADSFLKAIMDLKEYLESDGSFDGIISFSQWVSLASAFITVSQCFLFSVFVVQYSSPGELHSSAPEHNPHFMHQRKLFQEGRM